MSWRSALFTPGRMDEKTRLFLLESRTAHDRLTNLLILTYPLLAGVWQFRETAKHFAGLGDPTQVRDAVLSYIRFPADETAVRRLDFTESVSNISWERQRDSTAEMMFLICCSIYENYAGQLQGVISKVLGRSISNRQIEKGFQFPATSYDLNVSPPVVTVCKFTENLSKALNYLPTSSFMVSHLCPHFPLRNGRQMLDDLDLKLHTYLLFKKLRNSIVHGNFDPDIPLQYKIVDGVVTKAAQGLPKKISVSTDGSGSFFLTLYDVVGFVGLLLNIITDLDFLFLISIHGEKELIARLAAHKEAKKTAPSDKRKEFSRMKLCLQALGVKDFHVDENARSFFISQQAWRP
jgi:hypothetical protein